MATINALMRDWQRTRAPIDSARTNATNIAPVNTIDEEFGEFTPDQLSLRAVERFRNSLLEKGLSKVTVARYLSVLRAGLNGHADHLPLGKLIAELKRGPNGVECWTKEEAQKIISTSVGNEKRLLLSYFIEFLFATGMRRGEALALQYEDVDNRRKRIHIHRALDLDGNIQKGTKWGGERWFPMSPTVRALLDNTYEIDRNRWKRIAIFGGLDQRTVGRQFNRVRDAAGVRPFKLHCTRHSAISWALTGGISLRKASEIFGVSQQVLEKHYAHYIEEDVDMGWANL